MCLAVNPHNTYELLWRLLLRLRFCACFYPISRYLRIAVELNCRQVFSIVFSFNDVRAIKPLVEQFLCLFPQNAQQSKGQGRQEAVVCAAYRLCNLNLWHWLGIGNRYCKYKEKHRYTEMILLLLLTSFFPLLLFAMNHKLRTSVVLFCFRCPTVIQSVQECLLCSVELALISPRNCKRHLCLSFFMNSDKFNLKPLESPHQTTVIATVTTRYVNFKSSLLYPKSEDTNQTCTQIAKV